MRRDRPLDGQTLVVIGGSSGIGLEAARQAGEIGGRVIITARDPERVHRAGSELNANIAAFDATDHDRLRRFFDAIPTPIDHVLVTVPAPASLPLQIAGTAARAVRPGGTLLFIGCPRGRGVSAPPGRVSSLTATLRAMTEELALELAPTRVNTIAAGFVDTPLSAAVLGDRLEARRAELRARLPIRRLVLPEDVASLAVHLLTNTAVTGELFDIDGGQKLIERS